MNDVIKEQLSAFLDDELGEAEKSLLLRRLESDAALREQLLRYQLIRETVHQQLPEKLDLDFSSKVMQQIDDEPTYALRPNFHFTRWLKPIAGMAVAASVATLAIIGAQSLILDYKDNGSDTQPIVANDYKHMSRMHWNIRHAELGNRLNGYLVNHSEYTSSYNLQGMLHYVRIAGYDSDEETKEKSKPNHKDKHRK